MVPTLSWTMFSVFSQRLSNFAFAPIGILQPSPQPLPFQQLNLECHILPQPVSIRLYPALVIPLLVAQL